jgi:hypothetical protein
MYIKITLKFKQMRKVLFVLILVLCTGCGTMKKSPKKLSPCEQLAEIENKVESLSDEEKFDYLIVNLQLIRDLTTLCDMQKSKGH